MADIRLAKPAAGASESVQCAPEARFVFDFPTTDATLARDGDNLNIRFEDGSNLQLEGFYQQYNEENLPSFNIDGTEVAAADFFAAMNEPDLMPAAGPGTGTVANGARFHEWGDSALTGGILHLDGLDWGFSRSFEWDDVPNAVGRNGDEGGLLFARGPAGPANTVPDLDVPPAPERPYDPRNPGDDPNNPVSPQNPRGYIPNTHGATIVVDEGALANGSGQHVLHGVSGTGAFVADVHAERGGSIELSFGGKVVTLAIPEDGSLRIAPAGDARFADVNGVDVRILGAQSAGDGKWTVRYEYRLTDNVDHDKQLGQDTVRYDGNGIAIKVTDGTGDVTHGKLTVEVHDDVPHFSVDTTGETTSLEGTFDLTFGADRAAASDAFTAEGATATTVNGNTTSLTFAEGTLTITNNGGNAFSYTFTPSAQYENLEFSKDITLTAMDGDRDTDTLTITVGQPKAPTLKDPEPDPDPDPDNPHEAQLSVGQIIMDEGAMKGGSGVHAEHGVSDKGSFTVDMHGENGTITVSDGTHTALVTLEGNRAVVTDGKLHINGVDVEITGARLAGTEWTVTYKYALTERVEHEDSSASGEEDTASDKLIVTATDDDGEQAHAVLNVFVHDDAPHFSLKATGNKASLDGKFGLNFGADTAADIDSLTADDAEITVAGNITTMVFKDGTLTITNNGNNSYAYTFEPADKEAEEFSRKIDLKATDKDGDTDTITITVGNVRQPTFPDDPTPNPDDPDVLSVGRITVDEGAMADGTRHHVEHGISGPGSFKVDMHGEEKGTITVSDADGGEVTIRLEGNSAHVTGGKLHVNGVEVEILDARPVGSEWTINYTYTLTERAEHTDPLKSDDEDVAPGQLYVSATYDGEDAEPATAVIDVFVHDDAPQFETHATGNKTKFDGSFGLKFGADTAAEENPLMADGALSTEVVGDKTIMTFTEGTLTITNNGDNTFSYTFTPNADHENLEFSKKIMLTATDKDKDTDTIKITVGNLQQPSFPDDPKPDPDPDPTPDPDDPEEMLLSVGRITVDEGALEGGTKDHADHGVSKTGESFRVEMHGEDGTITVFDGENTVTITLEGTEASVSGGTLHINGVDVTITGAELEPDGTVWTVSYDYTLTERVEHDGVNAPNGEDTAYGKLIITATDDDGEQASAVLNVLVHDDAPQFSVHATGDKTKFDGDFELNFGADAAAEVNPLVAEGAISTVVDGARTIMEFTEGTLTITNNGGNSFSYTFTPNADHENLEFSKKIELTATDKDKDTDTIKITVGNLQRPTFPDDPKPDPDPDPTPDPDDPEEMLLSVGRITVDEGALAGGTQDHYEHGISNKTPQSFKVEMHGEDGTITISDDTKTVTIELKGGVATLPEAEDARTLHINGVDVTITDAELEPDGTVWTVSYDYTLTERVEHDGVNAPNREDTSYDKLIITATDDDGEQASAVLNVLVHDDSPQFSVERTGDKTKLDGEFGLNFGADKEADNFPLMAERAISTEVDGAKTIMEFTEGTLTITNNGGNSFSYTFTPNEDYENLEFSREIKLTATDKDQDTATTTIIVGQEKRPDFPDPKPDPDPDPVPEPDDPNAMRVSVGQIIADEGALEGGTNDHKDHGISKTGESFKVDMHGENGSITVSDGTTTATIKLNGNEATVENGKLHINGVDVTIIGAVRNGSQWTVSYDYVLRENVGHTDPEQSGQADTAYGRLFITATDDDDKQAHAVLNVRVHDDAPMFTKETFGTEETFKGEFGLNFGADKAAAANSLTAAGEVLAKHVESGNTTTMVFEEGTLTITNEGGNSFSYEFTPNADNENLEFSREIKLTATDGDKDTATTTIIVGQKKQPDFPDPKEPDLDDPDPMTLSVGDITVDEAAMDRGTHINAKHGTGKEGESFKVDMHGEDGSITVSYGGKSVEITLDKGKATLPDDCTLRINGVDVTITGAELERDGTVWTVKYDYQLVDNAPHENPDASYEHDTLSGALTVTARDDDGKEAHAALNVHVHDDKPMFTLATFGSEEEFAGSFTLNYGADKAATDQRALTAEGEDLTQHVESGKTTTMVLNEGKLTVTDNGGQSFSYTFEPNEKYANLEFNREIKLTAKDGDGDTATTTIKVGKFFEPEIITVNPKDANVDGTAVVMDEALLPEGTRGDGKEYEGSNAFSVNLHGESGSIVIQAGDETVTFNIPATEESSGPFATPEAGTNTQLHVNGVTITFTTANLVSGQWQVNYKYTLDGNIHHDKPGPTGADDPKLDNSSITITVTDSQNNEKTAGMSVEVLDDGPVLTGMGIDNSKADGETRYVDDSVGTIEGQLKDFAIGADREGAKVELSVSYDEGKTTEKAVFTVQNGELVHTEGSTNISVDENGKFSFTRPEGHVTHKGLDTYEFKAVITDSDQDHVDSSVSVSTNHKPEIDLTGIKVYESKLHVTENQEHEGSGYGGTEATSKITNGSFKVDTHGEGGTLELTWGGTPIKIVLDADDCWTPKDSDVCTFSNSYATLTIQSVDKGTVNYTYTLDKALTDKDTGNNGRNDVPADAIKVTLTDIHHNDRAEGEISVTVVDDAPVFKPVVMKELVQSTEPLIDKMDFMASDGQYKSLYGLHFSDKKADGTWQPNKPDGNWTAQGWGTEAGKGHDCFIQWNNGVQLTPSFVHYQYREEGGQLVVTNVIDVNSGILNSGKALYFNSAEGLSVGYADKDHTNAWNVSNTDYKENNPAGEIHIGEGKLNMVQGGSADKRYLLVNEYGGKQSDYDHLNGANVSEAVVFDLGKMAFGMDINLGMFGTGDRVLVTFMLTPKNCNDNVIVKTEVVTKATAKILVPEGFSKVIVSALPKGTYELDGNGQVKAESTGNKENGSGFTIKDVTFLKAKYTASGEVQALSADGVRYEWDWTAFTGNDATTPNAADVHIRGLISGDYKVEMKEGENGSWTARLVKVDDNHKDLHGEILFTTKLTADKDGVYHWEVNQYYEFKMANGADKPFQIVAVDGDGDRVSQEIPVNITFNRFHESKSGYVVTGNTDYTKDVSDDVLIGMSDANSLMYGKGGDDVLIGDGLHGSYDKVGVDAAVVNFLDNQLLKLADTTGQTTGNQARNDALFKAFGDLSKDQKDVLGVKLEELEDTGRPGHDALYGGLGRDFLIGGAGDDVLDGSGVGNATDVDQDVIYAGSGNDIIFYKSTYTAGQTYINGGSGTDILIAAGGKKPADIHANHKVNVEVLLSTNKASTNLLQITGHESLLAYGIVLGENSVRLDQAMWKENGNGTWSGTHSKTNGLTLYNMAGNKPGFEIKPVPNAELQNELQDEAVAVMSLDFDDVPELLYDTPDTPDTYDAASASGDTAAGPAPMLFAAARMAPAPLGADAPAAEGEAETRGERILGNDTDETLTGTGGDDFIDGGAGSDTIFAGAGDDLIVYDPTDYLIDGGSGIDFLLSGSSDPAHSLADMLGNWEDKGATENMPMVHDVEVMLKGVDTSLQNMDALAAKYGFSMDKDANGRDILVLDKGKWALDESQSGNGTNTYVNAENGITLETTLAEVGTGTDAGEQAAQTIVLANNG